jgi:hypothetical protein
MVDRMSHVSSHIANRHCRTSLAPPDNGFVDSRTLPTSPDRSDEVLPLHRPTIVGSVPTGPSSSATPGAQATHPHAGTPVGYHFVINLYPIAQ